MQGSVKKTFSAKAIKILQEYDWTCIFRESRIIVVRLIILGDDEVRENAVYLSASK